MKTKEFDLFEKYFNGEMSPEEIREFESLVQSDPNLSASFRQYLEVCEALQDKDTLDLRIKLKEIREENSKNRNLPDFFTHGFNWMWMAALLIIILGFTVVITLMITRYNPDDRMYSQSVSPTVSPKYDALSRELMRYEERSSDFNLESPLNAIVSQSQGYLSFSWTISDPEKLILDIVDWNGTIIFSSGKPVVSPYKVSRIIPPGIIGYRFRTEKYAYALGFLFVR